MRAAVYRIADGEILRIVDAPDDHIAMQCQEGEDFFINPPQGATHFIGLPVTIEEAPAKAREEALGEIREARSRRLSACDWTQIPDAPLSTEQRAAWAKYRQELRDFPGNVDIDNIVWPTPPQ